MSRFHRWLLKSARTVHVYVTLLGLALILFFAITGFMLNHIEWFVDDDPPPRVDTVRPLSTEKLPGGKLPEPGRDGEATAEDKLAVVETLRKEFGIAGELTSFDFVTVTLNPDADEPVERKQIRVEFLRAGEKVIAAIDRETRMTEVTHKYKGWVGVATDLHRGNRGNVTNEVKFTGKVWSLVIDVTCFLLLIIAATGLVLWWSLKSRGKWGALLLLLGTATTFAVYYWFVP